jgi:hypothetical protein
MASSNKDKLSDEEIFSIMKKSCMGSHFLVIACNIFSCVEKLCVDCSCSKKTGCCNKIYLYFSTGIKLTFDCFGYLEPYQYMEFFDELSLIDMHKMLIELNSYIFDDDLNERINYVINQFEREINKNKYEDVENLKKDFQTIINN